MQHCAFCGLPQRRKTEFGLRPSTHEEIKEAERLREHGGERECSRADMLASPYFYVPEGDVVAEGAVTDGSVLLRRTMKTLDEFQPFPYGGGLFCRMRCAEHFAVYSYQRGLRAVK